MQSGVLADASRTFTGKRGAGQARIIGAVDVEKTTIAPVKVGQAMHAALIGGCNMAEDGGVNDGLNGGAVVIIALRFTVGVSKCD